MTPTPAPQGLREEAERDELMERLAAALADRDRLAEVLALCEAALVEWENDPDSSGVSDLHLRARAALASIAGRVPDAD